MKRVRIELHTVHTLNHKLTMIHQAIQCPQAVQKTLNFKHTIQARRLKTMINVNEVDQEVAGTIFETVCQSLEVTRSLLVEGKC